MKYKGYTITRTTERYLMEAGLYWDIGNNGVPRYFPSIEAAKRMIRLSVRKSSPLHEEYRKLKNKIRQMEKRLDALGAWLGGETE